MSDKQVALLAVAVYGAALAWPWVIWLIVSVHFGKIVKDAERADDEKTERQDRSLDSINDDYRDGSVDHYARAVATLALEIARKRQWRRSDDARLTLVVWMLGGGYVAYRLSGWSVGLLQ